MTFVSIFVCQNKWRQCIKFYGSSWFLGRLCYKSWI